MSAEGSTAARCAGCGAPSSNVALLGVVFVLFGGFALAELFAAFAANSLALLGDAASMIVDASTYVANMIAERKKERGAAERTRLKLEFFIPLFSVTALFATSVYVIVEAVATITGPRDGDGDNTGTGIMLAFASVNLAIDVVSIACFARLNRLLGYKSLDDELEAEDAYNDSVLDGEQGLSASLLAASREPEAAQSNTNMCSAYTHVLADTLRSLAVMIAVLVSNNSSDVDGDLADAWAAVVVSAIIFLTIAPLAAGLSQKFRQLYVM